MFKRLLPAAPAPITTICKVEVEFVKNNVNNMVKLV